MDLIKIINSYNFSENITSYLIKTVNLEKNKSPNKEFSNEILDLINEFTEYQDSINRWKNIKCDYDNC